jgi:hypothetical protein
MSQQRGWKSHDFAKCACRLKEIRDNFEYVRNTVIIIGSMIQ